MYIWDLIIRFCKKKTNVVNIKKLLKSIWRKSGSLHEDVQYLSCVKLMNSTDIQRYFKGAKKLVLIKQIKKYIFHIFHSQMQIIKNNWLIEKVI